MRAQTNIFHEPVRHSHHAAGLTSAAVRCTEVLRALISYGRVGATRIELAATLHLRPTQTGAALGELRMWGRVRKTEALRDGQAVYLAIGDGAP